MVRLDRISVVSFALLAFTIFFFSGCLEYLVQGTTLEIVFHPGCIPEEAMLYIDNVYTDLIGTSGSYKYDVDPGRHKITVIRSSDYKTLWDGQFTVIAGQTHTLTLTCGG